MNTSAPISARPPTTPTTIPAIEPPLSLELFLVLAASAEDLSAAEVELAAETVMVFTSPFELVWIAIFADVVVSEEVEELYNTELVTGETNSSVRSK